jgi:SSS family solute:Na+ symporter
MTMQPLDWTVIVAILGFFFSIAWMASRRSKSVSDYLVAGRSAGRYILTVAAGTEWIGAINIVAMFQLFYSGGFPTLWWMFLTQIFIVYMSASGWGIYRFRETRAMTLAEFLEIRYDRRVRQSAGVITWIAGMLNFGIFPAVSARLFIALFGLGDHFAIPALGLAQVPTFPVAAALMLIIPAFFVLGGGHTTVLVSDFVQGLFMNLAAVSIVAVLMVMAFDWSATVECLKQAPAEASMLDPLRTSQAADFNVWYFLIGTLGAWYCAVSHVPAQAFMGSGRTAHEQRMGNLLGQLRWQGLLAFFMVVTLVAYKILHHPADAATAAQINHTLDVLSTDPANEMRSQAMVTAVLSHVLPAGMVGLFGAVLLAALISCHSAFMHAWGGVLLQDIVMPLRSTPFTPRGHIWALRAAIVLVAVIAFVYSLLMRQQQSILMYFAAVNSVWLGPSGAIMLGGLYWRKGTARAALVTLFVGMAFALTCIAVEQLVWPRYMADKFPINGQWQFFLNICISLAVYAGVSLASRKPAFDMDRMLRRGIHAGPAETPESGHPARWWHRLFGIGPMFNRVDRLTAYGIVGYFIALFAIFIFGTAYALARHPDLDTWARFWMAVLVVMCGVLLVSTVWLGLGGIRDLLRLLRALKAERSDAHDDGWVEQKNTVTKTPVTES